MPVKYLFFAILFFQPLLAVASHKMDCTIHVAMPTGDGGLAELATVTRKDAETIALANLSRVPGATISAQLEVEKGCLVWSLDFQRTEKPGSLRVLIDAGDGRFLSQRTQIPVKEHR